MSKFKVGDEVRILPSAVDISIAADEVGKTGVIERCDPLDEIIVLMDKPRMYDDFVGSARLYWIVESSQIELVIKIGQQLMFSFME